MAQNILYFLAAAFLILFVSSRLSHWLFGMKKLLDPATAASKIREGALLIDVRSPEEYQAGHIAGAENIPHTDIGQHIDRLKNSSEREILLYCRSGNRSDLALRTCKSAGIEQVYNAGTYERLAAVMES